MKSRSNSGSSSSRGYSDPYSSNSGSQGYSDSYSGNSNSQGYSNSRSGSSNYYNRYGNNYYNNYYYDDYDDYYNYHRYDDSEGLGIEFSKRTALIILAVLVGLVVLGTVAKGVSEALP